MKRYGFRHVVIALVTIPLMTWALTSGLTLFIETSVSSGIAPGINVSVGGDWQEELLLTFGPSILLTLIVPLISKRRESEPWLAGILYFVSTFLLSAASLFPTFSSEWKLLMYMLPVNVGFAFLYSVFTAAGYYLGNLVPMPIPPTDSEPPAV